MNVDAPKRDLKGPFLNRLTGFWGPLRNLSAARSRAIWSRSGPTEAGCLVGRWPPYSAALSIEVPQAVPRAPGGVRAQGTRNPGSHVQLWRCPDTLQEHPNNLLARTSGPIGPRWPVLPETLLP